MDTLANTAWQRKGSCIIFDRKSLGPLIAADALVSLRQAMSWLNALPAVPPVTGRTILVSGLETIIETMEPLEAEEFLCKRVRPLLIHIQSRWTDCGIVFGFSTHPKAFEETSFEEEVLFGRRDQKKVRLSEGLWDGSATLNMKRLVREADQPEQETTIGYHVARIS